MNMFDFFPFIVLFDSEKDGFPIAPGESQEKYVSWKPGSYQITAYRGRNEGLSGKGKYYSTEEYGDLIVNVFTEDGQRVASSQGNFTSGVQFLIPKPAGTLKLKIKVTRTGGSNKNKMPFWVSAEYTDI